MESRRSSNRNTAPGLREIDLATVRAQYVLEHKTGAVGGDHLAETQFQVRHMKISKPRPLPISKSARSPRPRSHSKLQKARPPPPPIPSSSRQDEPAPLLAPLIFDDAPDPEPMFSTSAHLPPHPDPHQSDESLTCLRDRRAGIVLQLGTPSALSETSPGDLARSLFEARIARRKSYLGHPDYYIPRSVKTRASVVSQAPSTARLNALDDMVPPLPGIRAHASTSTLSPVDLSADEGDAATQSHPVATYASAPTKRPKSDVAKKLFSLSRSSSLPNPIAKAPRRVLVEEVTDEGTPPAPYTSLPMTSTPQRTREASTAPSDGVVEGFYSLRISTSPNATPGSSLISTSPRSIHADLVGNDELPAPVFASLPEPSTRWRASNVTSVRSRMSTVLEEEPSPLPASTHLPSVQSNSTVSLVHSVFTHEQPSGDGPDTSGTSLSAHARTPRKAAENLPSTSIRDSQRHSVDKPLPTLPALGGTSRHFGRSHVLVTCRRCNS
ncbi:hypothetical protein PENSPDRAFT_114104 [Peniophora sp. CONT]|nr:hypothetical protein PENSPDRAFT_114104 [Peniophora sp. CONT]